MKKILFLVLAIFSLTLFGCSSSSDPDAVAKEFIKNIKSNNYDNAYDMLLLDAGENDLLSKENWKIAMDNRAKELGDIKEIHFDPKEKVIKQNNDIVYSSWVMRKEKEDFHVSLTKTDKGWRVLPDNLLERKIIDVKYTYNTYQGNYDDYIVDDATVKINDKYQLKFEPTGKVYKLTVFQYYPLTKISISRPDSEEIVSDKIKQEYIIKPSKELDDKMVSILASMHEKYIKDAVEGFGFVKKNTAYLQAKIEPYKSTNFIFTKENSDWKLLNKITFTTY